MNLLRDFYNTLLLKAFFFSLAFIVWLTFFELVFLSHAEQKDVLLEFLAKEIYIRPLFQIILSFASIILITLLIYCALILPYKFKIVFFFFFCLAVLVEYGLQNGFSRFSRLGDAEIAYFTDSNLKLNAVVEYFNYMSVIPCLVFGLLLFFAVPIQKRMVKPFLIALFFTSTFFLLTAYFTNNMFYTVSPGAFYRTLVNYPTNWFVGSHRQPSMSKYYYAPRMKVDFLTPIPRQNNIVFIVDESVRGDHLSLNGYSRPTTPLLDDLNQKGFIKNWGIAVSGTTCSVTSNNLLLTGITELPDLDGKVFTFPTIFQYAKAMGYKTYYLDGMSSYTWNGKPSDINDYEWINANEFKEKKMYEVDEEIARRIREITTNSTGNFIWINKFGMHVPYNNSYPDTETVWTPTSQGDHYTGWYRNNSDNSTIVNNYDNAIRFNSQKFFSTLFINGVAKDTFYVYTSDHGQTLSENGEKVSHCSDAKSGATVPLFIIANPETISVADTAYKATHSNIFATLLDLMNFPENKRKYNYALSLLKAKAVDSQPRFYYSGNLYNENSGRKYLYDKEE